VPPGPSLKPPLPPSSCRLVPGPAGWCRRPAVPVSCHLVHPRRQSFCSCCCHLVRWCCSCHAELLNCIDRMTVASLRTLSDRTDIYLIILTALVVLRTLQTFFTALVVIYCIALVVGHFRPSCCTLCRSYYLVVILLSSVGWLTPKLGWDFLLCPSLRLGLSAPGGAVVRAGEDIAKFLGPSPSFSVI